MGRFDRYLLGQLMRLFGFFSLVLVLIYWVNRAVVLFDQLIADGQTAWVFLEFTALSLPGLIRLVLPLAAVIGALYVTNRLTSESELVVVQATGFSPARLARPVFVFGTIVAVLTGILTHALYPLASARLGEREQEIAQNVTARLLTEGQFMTPAEGVTVYIRDITEAGELRDLFLADTRGASSQVIYTASRAYLVRTDRGPQLIMVDGLAQTLRLSDQRLFTTRFEDFAYDVAGLMSPARRGRLEIRDIPSWDLVTPSDILRIRTNRSATELHAALHERNAQALMALVGALIGFSSLLVGGFSRFGVWRQLVVAILLVVLVMGVNSAASAAVAGDAALWPLYYAPSAVGLTLTGLLLLLAARPALLAPLRRRRVPAT